MRAQCLDARALRREQAALGIDHVELARDAVLIAQALQENRLRERLLARRFRLEALALARLSGECGAHLTECVLDGIMVLGERLLLALLGCLGARLQAAA